jgi:hypothetical protein
MLKPRQISLDAGVAGALLAALALVFVFDRRTVPAAGTGPAVAAADAAEGSQGSAVPANLLSPRPATSEPEPKMAEPEPSAPAAAAPSDASPVAAAKPPEAAPSRPPVAPLELPLASIYSARTMPKREEFVAKVGGTVISEKSVQEGLDWLARHQAENGSWGNFCLGQGDESRCERPQACSGTGNAYDIAHTALAVLAFQAGGHFYFNDAQYSKVVRRGLDWLVDQQSEQPEPGDRPRRGPGDVNMYEQGMSTFALAEACAVAHAARHPIDEKYRAAAMRGIRIIEAYQHNDGGWRYDANLKAPSDTSVSGWQVLALKTALSAELPVEPHCLERIEAFFKKNEIREPNGKFRGRTAYLGNGQITEATTGVGMLVHQFVLHRPDSPLIKAAAPHLATYAEQHWGDKLGRDPDFYLWYNCTLAMFQVGGDDWDRWNAAVRDSLIHLQRHAGCERGSWDPSDQWGHAGGRIYSTALAVLTLEVYYRFAKERLVDTPPENAPQP